MSNIILSAFADEYAPSFDEQIEALRSFGIKYIELRHLDGKNISTLSQSELLEAKKKLDCGGIAVSAIGSPLGKIALDGDLEGHFEMAKRIFDHANLLDTRLVRVFSFYAPRGGDIREMKSEVVESLGRMLDIADSMGVVLCHENEAKIYGDIPERCRELLDCFSGRLRCVFDMGNYVLEGVKTYPEAYELLKNDIEYFHIKDALYSGAIVPPGKGESSIAEIISAHKAFAEKDFFVSLEPHLEVFSGLKNIAARGFVNPYRYESAKAAFADAVDKFKEIV